MKQFSLLTLFLLLITISTSEKSSAQTGQLLGGNVLNGALTGTALGAATMGLQNSSDFAPLRIGLGAGILAGAGVAVYDIVTLPQGQEFFISGMFNDGNNSSVIVLLDTFYGAAGGAILGSAVMLISNSPIVDGLQYGSGVGAWVGFGVGLFDSFIYAERNSDFVSSNLMNRDSLIEYNSDQISVGLIAPDIIAQKSLSTQELRYELTPALKMVSFKAQF
ncbi:hypothetical protein [Rhodohalobacter barkolensis]|uniref:Uncharacterized protein n=1 Tax=Rhodohalobacter barkolensis TaxID=2053187 RepID=A0A2N0VI80_9BACT|nr:hypothetical protein [Rhodohalobacter barkolensis]PKD43905.1 hypothetical protein CWD77_00025 [Rhodohalobacter barkolensis]